MWFRQAQPPEKTAVIELVEMTMGESFESFYVYLKML